MSYNTSIILNEILTNSTYSITRANSGLFNNSDEWAKLKQKILTIPEDCQLIYLEGWIKYMVDHEKKEHEEKERKEKELKDKERKEKELKDKEHEEKMHKERKEHEEKIFKDFKEHEERKKRERKEIMLKEFKEYKEGKEREEREREEREREKREREKREREKREREESSVARHTLFAHYGPGLAFAVPTPGYPGRHLVHMGGGTFIPSAAPIGFIAPGFIPGPCFVRAHRF